MKLVARRRIDLAAKLGAGALGLVLASAALAVQGAPTGAAKPVTPPGTPAPAAAAAGDPMKAGRELFANWSCGSCHTLADAGAEGHVGPSLDGNTALTEALVKDRVTNGQGAMPAFGGQMTDAEIATIAAYVVKAKK